MRISDADEPGGKFHTNVSALIPIIAYPVFLLYRIRLLRLAASKTLPLRERERKGENCFTI